MSVRKLRLIHTPTPNWATVRDFYVTALQLPPAGGWSQPGDRGAFLDAGAGEIEVMELDAATLGILPGAAPGWHLALEVDDLDDAYARVRNFGATIVRQPGIQPWGTRDLVVRDPAGNLVLLFEEDGPDPG
jgi:catechol 2,3-dioxygenase-like lactoylglutathione lyase family enzyme